MTFQASGITSSVSVTSSPSFNRGSRHRQDKSTARTRQPARVADVRETDDTSRNRIEIMFGHLNDWRRVAT